MDGPWRWCLVLALLALAASAHAAAWRPLRVPGYWETEFGGVVEKHDGFAWYRCFVHVPAAWEGLALHLALGRIDDCDETFVNGAQVGAMGTRKPHKTASGLDRNYTVDPRHVRFGGANLIAVRVWDQGGAGGISHGPLRLACDKGAASLEGHWQFRTGDDLAWAKWPADPASDAAKALVAAFLKHAGPQFGKAIDYEPLPGTKPLTMSGDIASRLVAGVDRFLLRELEKSVERRARHWTRDLSSHAAYAKSVEPNRKRLAHVLGVREPYVSPYDSPPTASSTAIDGPPDLEVRWVRWPAFADVHGEGLVIEGKPKRRPWPRAVIVAIPDASQHLEALVGKAGRADPASQWIRRLARSGCTVVVPQLISRDMQKRRSAVLSHREYVYRPAFELGRHIIGYELNRIHSIAASLSSGSEDDPQLPCGLIGWGEGGLLALYGAALHTWVRAACVSGCVGDDLGIWQQPIDRNVFGFLDQFGHAEVASLIAPRPLIVEAAKGPELTLPGRGGAPARLVSPSLEQTRAAFDRARQLTAGLKPAPVLKLTVSDGGRGAPFTDETLQAFLHALDKDASLAPPRPDPKAIGPLPGTPAERQQRLVHDLDRHTQRLLAESPYVRRKFMGKLDTSSLDKYRKSVEWYRRYFRDETIGRFDHPLLPPNPRTRKAYDEPKWTGYEVVLDVFPDVIAYGILLVPKDIQAGDKRPVVVCQHGLEGRPEHVVQGAHRAYHDFAAVLAGRGFVTFAPQNLYIFRDRFRTLQRKANLLGKTLFSVIVPQHQQICGWLKSLPYVDGTRIAFYGLSYGGKTAMRVPPLVPDYCLSICSADFNDWVWKNASTLARYSYVWTGEYEIFEFDLGSTFNYAEMAALICPRPFMVERGHFDGVAPDERVAYEFAKVRHLYQARLGLGDRCAIEWFVGPHTIHGKGTYDFLHKHLRWPKPPARD